MRIVNTKDIDPLIPEFDKSRISSSDTLDNENGMLVITIEERFRDIIRSSRSNGRPLTSLEAIRGLRGSLKRFHNSRGPPRNYKCFHQEHSSQRDDTAQMALVHTPSATLAQTDLAGDQSILGLQ
jgi:hypothetical protein